MMALLCKRCYADVTEDIEKVEPRRKFRCKCGSGMFIQQNDDPMVPYTLSFNDRRFLKSIRVAEGTEP